MVDGARVDGDGVPQLPELCSPAWLKLEPKLSIDAVVTGGSAERLRWNDDWSELVMLEPRYTRGSCREMLAASRAPSGEVMPLAGPRGAIG